VITNHIDGMGGGEYVVGFSAPCHLLPCIQICRVAWVLVKKTAFEPNLDTFSPHIIYKPIWQKIFQKVTNNSYCFMSLIVAAKKEI
jgi:hypothetical protein